MVRVGLLVLTSLQYIDINSSCPLCWFAFVLEGRLTQWLEIEDTHNRRRFQQHEYFARTLASLHLFPKRTTFKGYLFIKTGKSAAFFIIPWKYKINYEGRYMRTIVWKLPSIWFLSLQIYQQKHIVIKQFNLHILFVISLLAYSYRVTTLKTCYW